MLTSSIILPAAMARCGGRALVLGWGMASSRSMPKERNAAQMPTTDADLVGNVFVVSRPGLAKAPLATTPAKKCIQGARRDHHSCGLASSLASR